MATAADPAAKREKEMSTLRMEIRSILMSAGRNGVSVAEFQRDFEDLNGRPIPMKQLGFRDLNELIKAMPDVVRARISPDGHIRLYAVSDESTKRLEKLISKQKQSRPTRFGGTEQQQQTVEDRRNASERKRLIEKRMIEIASRGNGFIAYTDLCRKYRATYGEVFDPKVEFNCAAKAVFTAKLARSFTVVGKGATGGFMVRLKDTVRLENLGDLAGMQNGASAFSAPRFSGLANQSSSGISNTSAYNGGQGYQSSNNPLMRRQPAGFASGSYGRRFAKDLPPRFAGAASNKLPAPPPRFVDSATANTAAARALSSVRTQAPASSSTRSSPAPTSQFAKPSSLFSPLSVTVSTSSDSGSTVRSVAMPPRRPLVSPSQEQRPPRAMTSPPSRQDCAVGIDFLRKECGDICELDWSEGALRYFVKPLTPKNEPLSSMASVAAALPSVSLQSQPSQPSQPSPAANRSYLSLEELKQQLKAVLRNFPSGITYFDFQKAYQNLTGQDLDLAPYDLWSLAELADLMPDIFRKASKENGEVLLFEAKPTGDTPVPADEKCEAAQPISDTQLSFEGLLDRFWVLAMNAPKHSLHYSQIPGAYENTFGTPLPAKDLEDLSMMNELFDYDDRFDFSYEGGLCFIAHLDYKPSEESLIEFLTETKDARVAPEQSAGTERVSLGEQFIAQALPGVDSCEDGDSAQRFEVYVGQVENPGRFFIHLRSFFDQLEVLTNEINDFYSAASNAETIPASEIQAGMPCVCRDEDERLWCRGLVEAVDGDDVTVLLVDFGTEVITSADAVYYLPRRFFSLPAQAIECCLAYLSPPGETWSVVSGEVITQFCGNSVLCAELCKVVNGVAQVHLAKNVDGNQIYLNDVLLDANLAVFNQEEGGVAAATNGNMDDAELEDETGSGADNSSVHSYRTAVEDESSFVDLFSTPQGLDPATTKLIDLSFEQDIIDQLRTGEWNEWTEEERREVITMARIVLSRKRVALTARSAASAEVSDIIVDKLSWLEREIQWLKELEEKTSQPID